MSEVQKMMRKYIFSTLMTLAVLVPEYAAMLLAFLFFAALIFVNFAIIIESLRL